MTMADRRLKKKRKAYGRVCKHCSSTNTYVLVDGTIVCRCCGGRAKK